ncbi:Gfo/Idh/MocA family protein [Kitasatospora sp. NPDC059088]|uniref:Gfo/Idh/MocA family protein n=1 Tax=Kitasatospora sp. NPDC059088 TaxID=3346722 RepID=UPI0036AD3039
MTDATVEADNGGSGHRPGPLRVAVVGTGLAGTSHLFDLSSSDTFEIAAVCSARMAHAERAATLFAVPRCYDDYRKLLDVEALDGLVIAAPPQVAGAVLAEAIPRGLLVLAEKPGAEERRTLSEIRRLLQSGPDRVSVAYNRRYLPHVRTARSMVRSGALGVVTGVRCEWKSPFAARYRSRDTHRYRTRRGYGVLLDTASHIVDTLLYLGIEADSVTRAELNCRGLDMDVSATLELCAGSSRIHVLITDDAQTNDGWHITIQGDRGELHMSGDRLIADTTEGQVSGGLGDTVAARPVDDLTRMYQGTPPRGASLSEAAEVLGILDEARQVAGVSSGRWSRPRAKALGRLNGSC